MNIELQKQIALVDVLTQLICNALKWDWSDVYNGLVNEDNELIEWEDFDSVPLNLDGFIQVNFWGDGTLELQENNGESINIYQYDVPTITNVVNALEKYVA